MQAFRLIDRENKGYISREDVWRILGTTNVEDFEQIQDNSKNSNNNNGMGSHGSHGSTSVGQTSPALSQSSAAQGPGHAALSAASSNHAGNTNITAAHANLMSLSAAVGSAVGVSTRRRTLSVNGSGRTQPSGEDITDQRNRKLELRIDEIMEQADLNNDGVIRCAMHTFPQTLGCRNFSDYHHSFCLTCSYNEFLYAISGGDMSHSLIASSGGANTPASHLMLDNLTNAPPILHLGQNEESFVSSLKKKLSVSVSIIVEYTTISFLLQYSLNFPVTSFNHRRAMCCSRTVTRAAASRSRCGPSPSRTARSSPAG